MARNGALDDLAFELAERQHGAFAVRQFPAGWCSSATAAKRAGRGEWSRILPGTFGLPGSLDVWTFHAAMCLYVPLAAVTAVAACEWWQLDGLVPARTTFVVPPRCGARHPLLHRSHDLRPADVLLDRADGCLRVTDPTRSLIDAAAVLPPVNLERSIESAIRRALTNEPRLATRARGLQRKGRRGPAQVREVLGVRPCGGGADSDGEVILLQLLRSGGAPAPHRQFRVGGLPFDLVWPDAKVIVELDGDRHRTIEQMRRDARKQNRAVLEGWIVLRITWDRMVQEPDAVVAEVLAALAARSHA